MKSEIIEELKKIEYDLTGLFLNPGTKAFIVRFIPYRHLEKKFWTLARTLISLGLVKSAKKSKLYIKLQNNSEIFFFNGDMIERGQHEGINLDYKL